MEKEPVNIKIKQLEKKAKENYENFSQSSYAQNPIEAKFSAFKKTKKEIKIKDLF